MKFFKVFQYFILAAIIAFAAYRLVPHLKDFHKLAELKDQINYFWLTAALISQCFQYVGDGWLSQLLLKIVGIRMNMQDTLRIASLNVFAAHLLPIGEAGGMAAAYHFYRKLGVSPENFIFLTICWSLITNILLIIMLVLPIIFLPNLPIDIKPKTIIISISLILLAITTIYFWRKVIYRKLDNVFGNHSWFKHLASFLSNRKKYFNTVKKHPMLIFLSFVAGLIYYSSNIATLAFSFLIFNTLPHFSLIIFAYAASLLFGRITLAPGGIGAAEATLILIFLESGIDANLTVAAVLIYRIMSFWLPIPAGAISFYSLRKKTSEAQISR